MCACRSAAAEGGMPLGTRAVDGAALQALERAV